MTRPEEEPPEVVVVGVCASGKTTLVEGLRRHGIRARSVAQEHSGVPYLWACFRPQYLVYLEASLEAVRRRRPVPYGPERLEAQRARLAHAREHADLVVDTDALEPEEVLARVLAFLRSRAEP